MQPALTLSHKPVLNCGQYFGRVDSMKIHNYLLPHSNHPTGSYDTQPNYSPVVENFSLIPLSIEDKIICRLINTTSSHYHRDRPLERVPSLPRHRRGWFRSRDGIESGRTRAAAVLTTAVVLDQLSCEWLRELSCFCRRQLSLLL